MDKNQETAGIKRAEREDVHDILQGCKTYEDGLVGLWARSATHSERRPQGSSGGLASVGDLAKSKTKKRQARHRGVHLALL